MSLEPRLIKGLQAEYLKAEWTGKNESGLRPIGTSVLILMDQCAANTSGEAGKAILEAAGIEAQNAGGMVGLPPEIIEKMNHASESGTIVAIGDAAFRYYDDGSTWTDYKPKPGDHVFTERYAGRELRGADGQVYRMMTYTNIGGLHDSEVIPTSAGPATGNLLLATVASPSSPKAKRKAKASATRKRKG